MTSTRNCHRLSRPPDGPRNKLRHPNSCGSAACRYHSKVPDLRRSRRLDQHVLPDFATLLHRHPSEPIKVSCGGQTPRDPGAVRKMSQRNTLFSSAGKTQPQFCPANCAFSGQPCHFWDKDHTSSSFGTLSPAPWYNGRARRNTYA